MWQLATAKSSVSFKPIDAYLCAKLVIMSSDNALSLYWRKAITWPNDDLNANWTP